MPNYDRHLFLKINSIDISIMSLNFIERKALQLFSQVKDLKAKPSYPSECEKWTTYYLAFRIFNSKNLKPGVIQRMSVRIY